MKFSSSKQILALEISKLNLTVQVSELVESIRLYTLENSLC